MSDDPVKSALETFGKAARAIGLKGKALDDYVHEHMTKAGFSAKTTRTYTPGKSSGGNGGSWLDRFLSSDSDDSDDDD